MPRRARHSASRMCARTAHVKPFQRTAIVSVPEHRARTVELIQTQSAVKNIAADQTKFALEIERREHASSQYAGLEIGCVRIHDPDDVTRRLFFLLVPTCAIR